MVRVPSLLFESPAPAPGRRAISILFVLLFVKDDVVVEVNAEVLLLISSPVECSVDVPILLYVSPEPSPGRCAPSLLSVVLFVDDDVVLEAGEELLVLILASPPTILTEPLVLLFVFIEVALEVMIEASAGQDSLLVVVSFFDFLLLLILWLMVLIF